MYLFLIIEKVTIYLVSYYRPKQKELTYMMTINKLIKNLLGVNKIKVKSVENVNTRF